MADGDDQGGMAAAQVAGWWNQLDPMTQGVLNAIGREAPELLAKAIGNGNGAGLQPPAGTDFGDFIQAAAPAAAAGYTVPYVTVANGELVTDPADIAPNTPFTISWEETNLGTTIEGYTVEVTVTGPAGEVLRKTLDGKGLGEGEKNYQLLQVPGQPEGRYDVLVITNAGAPDPTGALPPAEGYKGGASSTFIVGAALPEGGGKEARGATEALAELTMALALNPFADSVELGRHVARALQLLAVAVTRGIATATGTDWRGRSVDIGQRAEMLEAERAALETFPFDTAGQRGGPDEAQGFGTALNSAYTALNSMATRPFYAGVQPDDEQEAVIAEAIDAALQAGAALRNLFYAS